MTTKKIAESSLTSTLVVRAPGDVPRMRDEDLGKLLGYSRPRDIRKQVAKELKAKYLNDFDVRASQARVTANGRPRKDGTSGPPSLSSVTEYWLTKRAALFIAARSDTQRGAEILTMLIALYEAAEAESGQVNRLLEAYFESVPTAAKPLFPPLIRALLRLRREPNIGNPAWGPMLASWVYEWAIKAPEQQEHRRSLNPDPNGSSRDYYWFKDVASKAVEHVCQTGTDFAKVSQDWQDWRARMELVFGSKPLQLTMMVPLLGEGKPSVSSKRKRR